MGNMDSGIKAGRLGAEALADNFTDLHPPLDGHEARVAADRCYFCHDAPCVVACPTSIDIPMFIRQIATGTPEAAARTIFDQNILGGMCARVCPVETLCEEACVREAAEGKPVIIGQLQRYATDRLMAHDTHPYQRAAATGKTIAVMGAGPAGLAAAHRLAMKGHDVALFDAKAKGGGLNEFGIASYKSTNNFAQAEVDWLLQIGGITPHYGQALGKGLTLERLRAEYNAVFLSIGLAGVNALAIPGHDLPGVQDAVEFIATLRQSTNLSTLPIGRRVVVIGGGMTAVDAAVQSKLLGADEVTIAYRRGQEDMGASRFEQDLATSHGVRILFNAAPRAITGAGMVEAIELDRTDANLKPTGEVTTLAADQVFCAIGQTLMGAPDGLEIERRKIATDTHGRTSIPGVWAGGDCALGGEDLTVTAVAEGRDAAEDIHTTLMGG